MGNVLSSGDKKQVDIIIATRNARTILKRCLRSVFENTKNWDFLITIVDDGSSDGTGEYLKSFKLKNVNVLSFGQNIGVAKAVNAGVRNTQANLIVLLDDDCQVSRGWLDGLYQEMKRRENVGIVGCKIAFPDGRIQSADYIVGESYIHDKRGEIDSEQRNYIRLVDFISKACCLIKREVFRKVGYFDSRFFPSQFEDLDFCVRVRTNGYKIIYTGEVSVVHHNLRRDNGLLLKNRKKFLRKWHNLSIFPLKDSHRVDRCNLEGWRYFYAGRYRKALTKFRESGKVNKAFLMYLFLGISLFMLGEYSKAILELKKQLILNPLDFYAHYYLAAIYKRIGKVEESLKEYSITLDLVCKYKHENRFSPSLFLIE